MRTKVKISCTEVLGSIPDRLAATCTIIYPQQDCLTAVSLPCSIGAKLNNSISQFFMSRRRAIPSFSELVQYMATQLISMGVDKVPLQASSRRMLLVQG